MSEPQPEPQTELELEPEPQPELQPEPPKRGRGRPCKDPNAPAKKHVVMKALVEEPVVAEPMEEPMKEEQVDPINKLACMIMQHECEQRENAMSR